MTIDGDTQQKRAWESIAIAVMIFAALVHFSVGWYDEQRLVFRPVGPATLFAFAAWLIALLAAGLALLVSRGRARWALVAAGVAVGGILLLFNP